VLPDALDLPFSADIDLDGRLCRTAMPVLDRLNERLDRTDTALVLASDRARILARWSGGPGIRAALERVGAVPGISLAEQHAGTNGLGTAVALDRPIVVSGAEHFAELYQEFTCAGVPIHEPFTGRRLGVVDLVCRFDDTSPLMIPLLTAAVEEIRRRLADGVTGPRRDGGARTRSIRPARRDDGRRASREGAPPSEVGALGGSSPAWQRAVAVARRHGTFRLPLVVSGEPGSGKLTLLRALWADAARPGPVVVLDAAALPLDGRSAFLGRLRAALAGAPAMGATAPAMGATVPAVGATVPAVAADADPSGTPASGPSASGVRASGAGLVVLRHLELLDERAALAVGSLLDERAAAPTGVAVAGTLTTGRSQIATPGHRSMLDRLGVATVGVPPLRSRTEDIPLLVTAIMQSIGADQRWQPEALAALGRAEWPGNLRQLHNLVVCCALGGPAGDIGPADLPPELGPGSGRALTPIEQLEMAAIVAGLRDAGGNKLVAASRLGISRSTLYRKLRAYGIDAEP
jgi:transcriptional regulator of acetoin/glycerol metabolism